VVAVAVAPTCVLVGSVEHTFGTHRRETNYHRICVRLVRHDHSR
jgi:hypothetical protein